MDGWILYTYTYTYIHTYPVLMSGSNSSLNFYTYNQAAGGSKLNGVPVPRSRWLPFLFSVTATWLYLLTSYSKSLIVSSAQMVNSSFPKFSISDLNLNTVVSCLDKVSALLPAV